MTRIHPNLYLGDWTDIQADVLRKAGITTILNVADNVVLPVEILAEFHCVQIALKDSGSPMWFVMLAVKVLGIIIENGGIVLVHCRSGSNRSPTVVASYVASFERRGFDEVWRELRQLRPAVRHASEVFVDEETT